jgi:UPF0176 protein
LCERLNLQGRIIISKHGINGTVGGSLASIKTYLRVTKGYPAFKDIDFKWSEGKGDEFPRLTIRVRDEIVTFGVSDEINVDEHGIIGGGIHLKPEEVNQLVADRGDEVVFFDGRNAFEARIGKFKNAIVPMVGTTPDFVEELESGKYDHLKNKPIITYCTGGIRCEVLSLVMKNRGFSEVYQIEGGIVRYGEKFCDNGLWEGSLYIFDQRLKMDFSNSASVLGQCDYCSQPTNQFHNCHDNNCHKRTLVCADCEDIEDVIACATCRTTAAAH